MEKVHDYSQKLIDDFDLIVVNPSPKLTDQEMCSTAIYFGSYSQDHGFETNTKIIFTHILKRCNESKSSVHPSTHASTSVETVYMKMYSIELK